MQVLLGVGAGAARADLGEVVAGPPLRGLPHPRLGQLGEHQRAAVTERRQIPHVLRVLGLRGLQHPGHEGAGSVQQHLGRLVGPRVRDVLQPDRAAGTDGPVDQRAHRARLGLRVLHAALVDPEHQLGGDQVGQAAEAHLRAVRGGVTGPQPFLLVHGLTVPAQADHSPVVCLAQPQARRTGRLPGAGQNPAVAQAGQGLDGRVGQKLLQRAAADLELVPVGAADALVAVVDPGPSTTGHRARLCAPGSGSARELDEFLVGQPGVAVPVLACRAQPQPLDRCRAVRHGAGPLSQRRVADRRVSTRRTGSQPAPVR